MQPAFAQHAFGGFERWTEDPVGLAVVADQRTVGEGEISLPAAACGHHRQHQVVRPGCFAGRDDAGEHRADRLPDIPPGVLAPLTQRFRVPVTEDRDVGVVVDQEQILGTQPQHDRKARRQHHRDRGPHFRLPRLRRAERMSGPIEFSEPPAHLPSERHGRGEVRWQNLGIAWPAAALLSAHDPCSESRPSSASGKVG